MNSLDSLTADQKAELYDLLLDLPTKEVVEKIAQPVPEGFGIKTHTTTLRRFKDKHWAELAADREESAKLFTGNAENRDKLATLDNGIQVAIRHHMFQRVSTPDCTDAQLALVSRWSHRQEKLKLEIQRVQIARERCAQNQFRLQLTERNTIVREKAHDLSRQKQTTKSAQQKETPLPKGLYRNEEGRVCDNLGPLIETPEDLKYRICKQFSISPEEYDRRQELCKTWKDPHRNPKHPLEINPVLDDESPAPSNANKGPNLLDFLKPITAELQQQSTAATISPTPPSTSRRDQ